MKSEANWQVAEVQVKVKVLENKKDRLLKAIEKAINRTSNKCQQITLSNYHETVSGLEDNQIDYDWYYHQLKLFK